MHIRVRAPAQRARSVAEASHRAVVHLQQTVASQNPGARRGRVRQRFDDGQVAFHHAKLHANAAKAAGGLFLHAGERVLVEQHGVVVQVGEDAADGVVHEARARHRLDVVVLHLPHHRAQQRVRDLALGVGRPVGEHAQADARAHASRHRPEHYRPRPGENESTAGGFSRVARLRVVLVTHDSSLIWLRRRWTRHSVASSRLGARPSVPPSRRQPAASAIAPDVWQVPPTRREGAAAGASRTSARWLPTRQGVGNTRGLARWLCAPAAGGLRDCSCRQTVAAGRRERQAAPRDVPLSSAISGFLACSM